MYFKVFYFISKEKFRKKFEDKKDTRWLDKLILLFKYNEQRIILKTIEKNSKKNHNNKRI